MKSITTLFASILLLSLSQVGFAQAEAEKPVTECECKDTGKCSCLDDCECPKCEGKDAEECEMTECGDEDAEECEGKDGARSCPLGKDAIKEFDADKDGTLNAEECKAAMTDYLSKAFDEFDKDGDSKLSKEEFMALSDMMRKKMANGAKCCKTEKRRRNLNLEEARANKRLKALHEQVKLQSNIKEKKRHQMNRIARKLNVPLQARENGPGTVLMGTYRTAERRLYEGEERVLDIENRLKMLQNLENQQLIDYASGLKLDSNRVPELKKQLEGLEADLLVHQAQGHGEQDPSVIAVKTRMEAARKNLDTAVASLVEVTKIHLEQQKARVASLRKEVGKRRDEAVAIGLEKNVYDQAVDEYREAKKLHAEMVKTYTEMKISMALRSQVE